MKIIALDIETKNLDMSADNLTFEDPSGWQVSCVSIYDHHRQSLFHYVSDPDSLNLNDSDQSINDFKDLGFDLEEWYYSGYQLITKNGGTFDLPIISKSLKTGGCGKTVATNLRLFLDAPTEKELPNGHIKLLTPKHFDICQYLRDTTGSRHKLQHLIQGTFGLSESKLMNAAEAPENWAAGQHQKVLDYCGSDAKYTADLFFYGRREGRIYSTEEKRPLKAVW
jgi:hypothetical protein